MPWLSAKTSPTIDSLLIQLEQTKDSEKYNLYLSLSNSYIGVDKAQGLFYADKVIADSLLVMPDQLAEAYQKRGHLLLHYEDNATGLEYLSTAYEKFLKLNVDGSFGSQLGSICMGQGRAERLMGNNFKSLKLFLKGIDHYRSNNDLSGEANCINHIGIVFNNIHDFESAKEYYLKCQKIYEQLGEDKGRVYIYNNLGYLEEQKNDYNMAMEYYNLGLELAKEIDFTTMIVHLLSNMSSIYIKLENYTDAQTVIDKGLSLASEYEMIRLGNFLELNKGLLSLRVNKSNQYFKRISEINEFAKTKGYKFLEAQSLRVLKEFYIHDKNYKKTLEITEIQKMEADSLSNSKLLSETSFLQSKFDYENQIQNEKMEETQNFAFKRFLYSLLIFAALGLIVSFFFIRELRASNRGLNDKNKELEIADKILEDRNKQLQLYIDSNAQLKKYARSTSHDIRSPLRTIGSYADLLHKNNFDSLDEKSKMHLNFITEGAARLYDITADMLNLATGGGNELYLEKIKTISLVSNVLKDLAFIIEMEKAEISVGKLPSEIIVDKIKFRRIIQNLIENAIKYRHPERSPKITISCLDVEDTHQFCIRDNGIGIDPSKSEKIFKAFNRLENTIEKDGIGIGLSICRNIIEKHGGKIWVNEKYQDGAEFCFTIPMDQESRLT